ncbi:hypothetical protein [Caldanaerobius fijiensis]|nr:hypothetical protein [Caldanaerobius fijiensis]
MTNEIIRLGNRQINGDKNSVIIQDDILDGIKKQRQAMAKTR